MTVTVWELSDVECNDNDGSGLYLHPSVQAGDKVLLSPGLYGQFVVTITQAGLDCDCGKMVLCPLNPQEKVGG